MPVIKEGNRFNKLTAIRFSHRNKWKNQFWFFRCDCGKEKVIRVNNVKNGNTKSCGCLFKKGNNLMHGMTDTKTHNSWIAMRKRCLKSDDKDYKYYGGRGITICPEWIIFENFFEDMGERLQGKTLDRKDNNGNYCKKNCRWATPKQQANNKRKI